MNLSNCFQCFIAVKLSMIMNLLYNKIVILEEISLGTYRYILVVHVYEYLYILYYEYIILTYIKPIHNILWKNYYEILQFIIKCW